MLTRKALDDIEGGVRMIEEQKLIGNGGRDARWSLRRGGCRMHSQETNVMRFGWGEGGGCNTVVEGLKRYNLIERHAECHDATESAMFLSANTGITFSAFAHTQRNTTTPTTGCIHCCCVDASNLHVRLLM